MRDDAAYFTLGLVEATRTLTSAIEQLGKNPYSTVSDVTEAAYDIFSYVKVSAKYFGIPESKIQPVEYKIYYQEQYNTAVANLVNTVMETAGVVKKHYQDQDVKVDLLVNYSVILDCLATVVQGVSPDLSFENIIKEESKSE